jgi:predicted lipid-binding transport protein (Tim44 family)
VAGVALVAFLMRRFGNQRASRAGRCRCHGRGPHAGGLAAGGDLLPAAAVRPAAAPVAGRAGSCTPEPAATAAATVARAFVPAAFDSEGFSRTAKMIFIRLQAANDTADLDDLRRFTTPELFASIRLEIQERGATPCSTPTCRRCTPKCWT